jgi:hypothetical protein
VVILASIKHYKRGKSLLNIILANNSPLNRMLKIKKIAFLGQFIAFYGF